MELLHFFSRNKMTHFHLLLMNYQLWLTDCGLWLWLRYLISFFLPLSFLVNRVLGTFFGTCMLGSGSRCLLWKKKIWYYVIKAGFHLVQVPKLASAAEYFFKMGVEGKRFRPTVIKLLFSSYSWGFHHFLDD